MNTTFTVEIKKTGETRTINFAALPVESQEYVIEYGLKQKLNDGHAMFTEEKYPDETERARLVTARVDDTVARLQSGDLARRGRTTDPKVAAARAAVAQLMAGGMTVDDVLALVEKKNKKTRDAA